eukprot:gene11472-11616_t
MYFQSRGWKDICTGPNVNFTFGRVQMSCRMVPKNLLAQLTAAGNPELGVKVLGLTNYSHWDKAADMRKCMLGDKAIADELLDFALKRIESFTHVGTTNKLYDSVESAAASLAMPLDGLPYGAGALVWRLPCYLAAVYMWCCHAPTGNVETGRALAWEDAMKLGEAPVPTATVISGLLVLTALDDNYGNARPGALDMHQLAADVSKKRAATSWIQQLWNKAEEAPQSHLRDLRGQLNAERAELSEAQDLLVTSRAEEAKKRELAQQGSQEDKTLGKLSPGGKCICTVQRQCLCRGNGTNGKGGWGWVKCGDDGAHFMARETG